MALPTTIYILLKNLTYIAVEGAASVTYDDAGNVLDVYDMETHRDLLDAGSIGRSWAGTVTIPPTPPTDPEAYDDRLSHTNPRETMKKRTMIYWWSGAGGTGDQLAACWSDQFIGYSGAVPRFVQ
jgi:hypothetical protein